MTSSVIIETRLQHTQKMLEEYGTEGLRVPASSYLPLETINPNS